MLDEVRGAGSYKKGTALSGNTASDLVVIMKNVPTEANVSNTMQKLVEVLNTDEKEETEKRVEERVSLSRTGTNVFELHTKQDCSVRVHFTSTGDKVYGPVPDGKDMKPYQDALRMIRHCRWWEEHTAHLKNARNLARLLKDLCRHVPGLRLLDPWHIELLSNCAVIPLVGDEPLSLVDSFKRVWQLLSAGLFLPGSIGIPDPCEETDAGVHESLPIWAMDELTRNSQMILQMLHFGAYQEILGVDGAKTYRFLLSLCPEYCHHRRPSASVRQAGPRSTNGRGTHHQHTDD
ncbi:Interleukin enhancer-binding factor 2 homolog [Geodia barretti]|uniref:Interleukin enhancer-binding factor 2 homolog n=1 Tax=Geodia barretti TaxID=519541 RepID=A0AA35XA37_GEOBA|nr:Interleukin enhancer-binding factor 2 homolog [Geodia barretti]